MRLRGAEDLHHACEQPFGADAHVRGLHGEPYRVDADHLSNSRVQTVNCATASSGQSTLITMAPRLTCTCTWVGAADAVAGGGSVIGTNLGVAPCRAQQAPPRPP
jgi:hypothetical protein